MCNLIKLLYLLTLTALIMAYVYHLTPLLRLRMFVSFDEPVL